MKNSTCFYCGNPCNQPVCEYCSAFILAFNIQATKLEPPISSIGQILDTIFSYFSKRNGGVICLTYSEEEGKKHANRLTLIQSKLEDALFKKLIGTEKLNNHQTNYLSQNNGTFDLITYFDDQANDRHYLYRTGNGYCSPEMPRIEKLMYVSVLTHGFKHNWDEELIPDGRFPGGTLYEELYRKNGGRSVYSFVSCERHKINALELGLNVLTRRENVIILTKHFEDHDDYILDLIREIPNSKTIFFATQEYLDSLKNLLDDEEVKEVKIDLENFRRP